MKKIVGAVLVATMLTGAAMADIGFSYKSSNYFTSAGGNLNYDHAARKDCLAIKLSNQYGGVVLDVDVKGSKLEQDEYYGWLNFSLPVGQLQVTAGVWNGRLVNRVLTDKGELDGDDFEKFKPGVVKGMSGADSDNLTEGKISVVAAYTLKDVLPGTLMAKLGLVKNTWNPDAAAATSTPTVAYDKVEDSDFIINAGFVGELMYEQADLVKAVVSYKTYQKGSNTVGVFISPLMFEKVNMMIGGTYAGYHHWDSTTKSWNSIANEWGFDLRLRYKVTDAFSLNTMNNLSRRVSTAEGAHEVSLWNMLNGTFKMADNIKAGLTLNFFTDTMTTPETRTINLTISPSVAIQATEHLSVTTVLRVDWNNLNFAHWDTSVYNQLSGVKVPVIVKFSL